MRMTRFPELILLDITYLVNPRFSFRQNSIFQKFLNEIFNSKGYIINAEQD